MPDLNHFWQRFLQALALLLGLVVGVGATIFGYSNTATVTVGFAAWHLGGVPLWAVALVPLGALLVLGTLYHWWSNFTHFTENIRNRHRVRELEQEVGKLKAHLDQVLDLPDHGATPAKVQPAQEPTEAEEVPAVEPATSDGDSKKATVLVLSANGEGEKPAAEATEEANSKA